MRSTLHMKILGGALLAMSQAHASAADPVIDAFYMRCVSENSYQMQPRELEEACACMAPVMASFLTEDARRRVEDAIKAGKAASLSGNPFNGDPAQLARSAIKQCPAVGEAMYRHACAGGNEAAPQCQEMRALINQVP
jgi:hypothetical protein